MTPEQLQQLERRIQDLERFNASITRPNQFFFDKDVHLEPKSRVIGGIYPGKVDGSSAAVFMPKGWTSAHTATGKSTITHNLGTTNYVVVATCDTTGAGNQDMVAMILTPTATTFILQTIESIGGALIDMPVYFIVMRT